MDYGVISSDSHVIEPHDLWQGRVAPEFKDRAPKLHREKDHDRLTCGGTVMFPLGLLAGVYRDDDETRIEGRWDEDVPRSGFDPKTRIDELARDGVDAEVVFPTIGMQFYPIDDPEFQWALMRAYNDWLAEEFCGAEPERFFGIAMINHEQIDWAIEEVKRARAMGLVGVMVPLYTGEANPYADPKFDPLWATAVEYGMPVNLHTATSRKQMLPEADAGSAEPVDEDQAFKDAMAEAQASASAVPSFEIQNVLMSMMRSGLFDRFPDLKVVSAENDAGWAGHMLENGDYMWRRWSNLVDLPAKFPPSHYFHNNIRVTFMRDRTAVLAREVIGTETLMWGNDYPHHVSTWPNSGKVLEEHFHDQPAEARKRIVRDNVSELYGIGTPKR